MFSKKLLITITLDKKKLKENGQKGSCNIECIPTIKLLTKSEMKELKECLNRACELLRISYIRSMMNIK